MTYHQSFSPCSRKNWVRASSKVSYAVLLSKFGAVFFWDSLTSLSCSKDFVNYYFFFFVFNSLSVMTALLVYHNHKLLSISFLLIFSVSFLFLLPPKSGALLYFSSLISLCQSPFRQNFYLIFTFPILPLYLVPQDH